MIRNTQPQQPTNHGDNLKPLPGAYPRPPTPEIRPVDDEEVLIPGLHNFSLPTAIASAGIAASAIGATTRPQLTKASSSQLSAAVLAPIEPLSPMPIRPSISTSVSCTSLVARCSHTLRTIPEDGVLMRSPSLSPMSEEGSSSNTSPLTRPAFKGFRRHTLRGDSDDTAELAAGAVPLSPGADCHWPQDLPALSTEIPDRKANTQGEPKRSASMAEIDSLFSNTSKEPIGRRKGVKDFMATDNENSDGNYYSACEESPVELPSPPMIVYGTRTRLSGTSSSDPRFYDEDEDESTLEEGGETTLEEGATEESTPKISSASSSDLRGAGTEAQNVRGINGYPNPASTSAAAADLGGTEREETEVRSYARSRGEENEMPTMSRMNSEDIMLLNGPTRPGTPAESESSDGSSRIEEMRLPCDGARQRRQRPNMESMPTCYDEQVRRTSTCQLVRSAGTEFSMITTREADCEEDFDREDGSAAARLRSIRNRRRRSRKTKSRQLQNSTTDSSASSGLGLLTSFTTFCRKVIDPRKSYTRDEKLELQWMADEGLLQRLTDDAKANILSERIANPRHAARRERHWAQVAAEAQAKSNAEKVRASEAKEAEKVRLSKEKTYRRAVRKERGEDNPWGIVREKVGVWMGLRKRVVMPVASVVAATAAPITV